MSPSEQVQLRLAAGARQALELELGRLAFREPATVQLALRASVFAMLRMTKEQLSEFIKKGLVDEAVWLTDEANGAEAGELAPGAVWPKDRPQDVVADQKKLRELTRKKRQR